MSWYHCWRYERDYCTVIFIWKCQWHSVCRIGSAWIDWSRLLIHYFLDGNTGKFDGDFVNCITKTSIKGRKHLSYQSGLCWFVGRYDSPLRAFFMLMSMDCLDSYLQLLVCFAFSISAEVCTGIYRRTKSAVFKQVSNSSYRLSLFIAGALFVCLASPSANCFYHRTAALQCVMSYHLCVLQLFEYTTLLIWTMCLKQNKYYTVNFLIKVLPS